jgi:uncharacterized repeat protein (TIGR01451 family)
VNSKTWKQSFGRVLLPVALSTGLAALGSAQAATLNVSLASGVNVIGGGSCAAAAGSPTAVGGACRYSNVVQGLAAGSALQRDAIVTIVSFNGGASVGATFDNDAETYVTAAAVAIAGTHPEVFSPTINAPATANAKSWVEYKIEFYTPGTSTLSALPGTVFMTSLDTDGDGTLLREFVEFNTPTLSGLATPSNLIKNGAGTPVAAGGQNFAVSAGNLSVNGITIDPQYKASAQYSNPGAVQLDLGAIQGATAAGATARLGSYSLLFADTVLKVPVVDGYKSVKLTTDADGNGLVTPGDTLTYTITHVNTGNADVTSFQISDLLPTGVAAVAGAQTVKLNGTVTAGAKNGSYTGSGANTALLAAGQTLPVGGTVSIDIPVTVSPVAADNTTLSNQTAATGGYVDQLGATVALPSANSDNVDAATSYPPSVTGATGFVAAPAGSVVQTQAPSFDATTVTVRRLPDITGNVYEDYNYGGGAGRPYNLAQGMSLRPGVRVELYNSAGNLVSAALTDASGAYRFSGISAGAYKVRAVNAFVTSSRSGGCAASASLTAPPVGCTQLPVQTYVNGDAARVGGELPSAADPALSTTTLPVGAQSLTSVTAGTVGSADVTGIDFGFNFDTVVNKNASGQGSLSQFITNANALINTGLAQSGNRQNVGANQALPAGVETSIFMASDGAVHPGLRSGLSSQLTGGVLVIDQSGGALPDVTGVNSAATSIDGTTQTVNVGNTKAGLLGTGGTVGYISTLTLDQVQRPEVEIVGVSTVATGVNLLSSNDQVRGVAVRGFGSGPNSAGQANVHIGDNYTGTLIEQNFLGFSAAAAALCNNATTVASGAGDNVRSDGSDNGILQNNLISCAGGKGFGVEAASSGWQILDNEIRANAIGNPTLDGIDLENAGSGSATVRGNLITQNGGVGVDGYQGGGGNNVTQNSVVGNGFGQAGTPNETAGVRLYSSNNTVKNNLITSNYGAGVMVTGGVSGNLISQNSIANNGALPAANGGAASGQIGIDLLLPADSVANGAQVVATTPLYVTKNDSGDADAGGNGLLNFPVFQSATIQGSNLVVIGYARPGSTVELFVAAPDPSGFGEGQTYLFTGKEGSAADTDAGTGTYNAAPGTDTTNRFQFTLPLPAGVSLGTPLTATASCLASDCTGTTVVSNSTSEFSYNILVQAAPVANNDSASTNPLVPVTFSVVGNDTPGASIDPASVIFDPSSTGIITNGGKTLTALEGIYVANNDGTVTFTPAVGFNSATGTSAKYTVKDTNGVSSNVANISVSVPANVDLGIVKTGPAYFKPGDTVTYTLKVTSTGTAPAGLKVTDTLPAGLTGVTADNGGVVAGTTITWTLPATTPVTLTVTGIAPTAAGDGSYSGATSLANTATVASTSAGQAESGAAATNNTSSTTAQLVYPRLSKRVRNLTAGGAFGTVGTGKPAEMLEYCIDFNNYGVAVNNFVVTDTVPTNTNSNPDGYGAGLGIQVNRATTTTRTSASDGDGASLSTTTLNTGLGTLAAGESGSVCFQASIK